MTDKIGGLFGARCSRNLALRRQEEYLPRDYGREADSYFHIEVIVETGRAVVVVNGKMEEATQNLPMAAAALRRSLRSGFKVRLYFEG